MSESKRKEDANGFWEVKDNPISKAGVYPYLGAQLHGAPDPFTVYKVYRPAEELATPECLESCRLVPFINGHLMLGTPKKGLTPAEEKGVDGVTGEEVRFEAPYLRATLKFFSESLKNDVQSGKTEISMGYFNRIEWTPGEYEGERYDAVMRDIRCNHIALVEKGRSGPDVAVMDGAVTTETIKLIKGENMGENDGVTLEKLAEAFKTLAERVQAMEDVQKTQAADTEENAQDNEGAEGQAKDNEGGATAKDTEGAEGQAKDNEGGATAKDTEGAEGQAKDNEGGATAKDNEGEAKDNEGEAKDTGSASMDAAVSYAFRQIARRDELAKKLTPHVGTFDHALMTEKQVAAYGCHKLGIQCAKGQESAALSGYLAAAAKIPRQPTYAMDAAAVRAPGQLSPVIAKYLNGK